MIRIGPAGWAYKDWERIVYPPKKPRGFDPVGYLAQYFDTIEINSTFYRPPQPHSAKNWASRVSGNPHFRFTAKLWRGFTHERNATAQDESEFKSGITPLMEAGRFGGLLLQFPWSFRFDEENRAYLLELHRTFQEFPLVLEVRHASWAQESVLDMLAALDVGLCNIDQPLFHRSIKPGAHVTSPHRLCPAAWPQLPQLVLAKRAVLRAIRLSVLAEGTRAVGGSHQNCCAQSRGHLRNNE